MFEKINCNGSGEKNKTLFTINEVQGNNSNDNNLSNVLKSNSEG